MNEIPLLTASDIEVKIKQVSEKGAVALLYKTARTDMAILDRVFGATNWTCDYKDIKDNLYCGIGVRESSDKEFVWKWDCGVESREDGEGNEKKGEASDAFKRAGFRWGIGRELYTAPFIFLKVAVVAKGNTNKYELADRFAKFYVSEIIYDDNRSIKTVTIVDKDGNVVFGKNAKKQSIPSPEPPPVQTKNNDANKSDTSSLICSFCQKAITTAEYDYSTNKFGDPACRACQKTHCRR